jgi:hypothetical protein
MAITTLDTHQTVKDLTAAGFSLSDLATKAALAETRTDLHQEIVDLRNEMKVEFANIRREMAEMKTELIKWVLGIGIAQVAAIVALLKLLPGAHP